MKWTRAQSIELASMFDQFWMASSCVGSHMYLLNWMRSGSLHAYLRWPRIQCKTTSHIICIHRTSSEWSHRPSDGDGTCFVWNIDTGEERSFRLFSFTNSCPQVNDRLVMFKSPRVRDTRLLIWKYEQEVSYVIDLEVPKLDVGQRSKTEFFLNGNNIYQWCYDYSASNRRIRICDQHDKYEVSIAFYCTKFSIADGSLLSHDSKTFWQGNSSRTFFRNHKNLFAQADRKGLVNPCLSISDIESSSLQSRPVLEDRNDYSCLLALCQYDTNSDQIMIRQQECIISRFLIWRLTLRGFFYLNRKNIVLTQGVFPRIVVTLRAQLGNKNESWLQVLKCKGLDNKVHKGRLLSVDDLCIISREDDHIVTYWFDQLAYEKARRFSDDSDPENDVNGWAMAHSTSFSFSSFFFLIINFSNFPPLGVNISLSYQFEISFWMLFNTMILAMSITKAKKYKKNFLKEFQWLNVHGKQTWRITRTLKTINHLFLNMMPLHGFLNCYRI